EDGDRARPARNGLDLPGPGELRLGGGQAVVAFAESGQVGGGESVVEGRDRRTARLTRAAHEGVLLCVVRGRSELATRAGPACFGREDVPPDGGTLAGIGRECKGLSTPSGDTAGRLIRLCSCR